VHRAGDGSDVGDISSPFPARPPRCVRAWVDRETHKGQLSLNAKLTRMSLETEHPGRQPLSLTRSMRLSLWKRRLW
jgi:hypothetical protein